MTAIKRLAEMKSYENTFLIDVSKANTRNK